MPQMAPMLWLILYVYFIMIFLFYCISLFFYLMPTSNNNSSIEIKNLSSMNWLW